MNQLSKIIAIFFGFSVLLFSCKEEEEERVIERGTVTDVEGNVYKTVKIGDQWWMAENLKTSKFRDGSEVEVIPASTDNQIWANVDYPACTFAIDSIYGFLYNQFAVQDDRNLAPEGWRIPTDEDWKKLEKAIGMNSAEAERTGWRGNEEGILLTSEFSRGWGQGPLYGTDEFGFNALPAGCRVFDGRRDVSGRTAFWWTSSSEGEEFWYRYLDASQTEIFRQHTYPKYAFSIRCVKE